MKAFEFVSASDVASALRSGMPATSKFIAGGTTLLDLMKLGVELPDTVVDINSISRADASLSDVRALPDGTLRIGALARMADVAWNPIVRDRYPMVSQSLLLAASGQLRNMASIGGNIMQRTRCPYFRDTAMACNKRDPGSGCAALQGISRGHAILGTSSKCIATHPSDLAVALTALDAVVRVRGARERAIPFASFHVLPGDHPDRETTLQHGELITAIDIPAVSFAQRSLYYKVRDRASYAFALASAAVALDVSNNRVNAARIALGGIGTKPWRSKEAERALVGQPATTATFRAAANAALAHATPTKDNKFKVELAKRTLVRALTEVSA